MVHVQSLPSQQKEELSPLSLHSALDAQRPYCPSKLLLTRCLTDGPLSLTAAWLPWSPFQTCTVAMFLIPNPFPHRRSGPFDLQPRKTSTQAQHQELSHFQILSMLHCLSMCLIVLVRPRSTSMHSTESLTSLLPSPTSSSTYRGALLLAGKRLHCLKPTQSTRIRCSPPLSTRSLPLHLDLLLALSYLPTPWRASSV